ncbi:DNA-binding transcriptional LysR family regulator [Bradyrhizobium macuxiense]|uniref:DNA-binding transcriptional LysR family regulator n=1 Tax=Bradyrhizobium macuxiense TaxID=1755647 RepID=A0A560LC32_9BRAD|nr:DNA-binding transcriptional LysR family regulator [Bradyrhizobium macuxiense]
MRCVRYVHIFCCQQPLYPKSGRALLAPYDTEAATLELIQFVFTLREIMLRALNIPIDAIRTIVAIAETGSLSKAATKLGLSQPAVSAQVKRLQGLIGGQLFVKTANGTTFTDLGELALRQARIILNANDQMLRLGGDEHASVHRVGLSSLFAQRLFERAGRSDFSDLSIHVDQSGAIRKGLIEGYIDVAFIFAPHVDHELAKIVREQRAFPAIWVRSRDFVLSPGAPIPIITLPGQDWMTGPLDRMGSAYKVVLHTSDYLVRLTAVRLGIGLTALPSFSLPDDLIESPDYYLPQLSDLRAVICARPGLRGDVATRLVKRIKGLFDDHILDPPGKCGLSKGL